MVTSKPWTKDMISNQIGNRTQSPTPKNSPKKNLNSQTELTLESK